VRGSIVFNNHVVRVSSLSEFEEVLKEIESQFDFSVLKVSLALCSDNLDPYLVSRLHSVKLMPVESTVLTISNKCVLVELRGDVNNVSRVCREVSQLLAAWRGEWKV